jgi:hypothetical protein
LTRGELSVSAIFIAHSTERSGAHLVALNLRGAVETTLITSLGAAALHICSESAGEERKWDPGAPTGMVVGDTNICFEERLIVIGEDHPEGWGQGMDVLDEGHCRRRGEGGKVHCSDLSGKAKVSSGRAGGVGKVGRQLQLQTGG